MASTCGGLALGMGCFVGFVDLVVTGCTSQDVVLSGLHMPGTGGDSFVGLLIMGFVFLNGVKHYKAALQRDEG